MRTRIDMHLDMITSRDVEKQLATLATASLCIAFPSESLVLPGA